MADKPKLWKKFDPLVGGVPCRLEGADACYYARERISGARYDASEANGLVANFKIEPAVKASNTWRWKHKENAAEQFAAELARWLPADMALAPIPGSKIRGDVEYDPRFDMMFNRLSQKRNDFVFCEPIVRTESVQATHKSDKRRTIEEVLSTFRFAGFGSSPTPKHLVFIDDVVTTGSHFSACRRLIEQHCEETWVYGVFWAKTVWPNTDDDS